MTDEEPRPTLPIHLHLHLHLHLHSCDAPFQPAAKHGTEPRPKPASHRCSAACSASPARESTSPDATNPQLSGLLEGGSKIRGSAAARRHHAGITPAPHRHRTQNRQKVADKGEIRTRAPLLRPGNPGGSANSGVPEPGALDRSATLPLFVEWCLPPDMWRHQPPPPPTTDRLLPKRNLGTSPHSAAGQRVGVHISESHKRGVSTSAPRRTRAEPMQRR